MVQRMGGHRGGGVSLPTKTQTQTPPPPRRNIEPDLSSERHGYRWTPHDDAVSVCFFLTDDFASATHACAAVSPDVRRSQTYGVKVFDQIPTRKANR